MAEPFLWLIHTVFQLIIFVVIVSAILSWLIAFNVVNMRNRVVATIYETTQRLTEPLLRPIRSVIPNLGGIDISPIILIIGLTFLEKLIFSIFTKI